MKNYGKRIVRGCLLCDLRGQSRNKINFRSGGWRDASICFRPRTARLSVTTTWDPSINWEKIAGPHSIGSRFICRINVEEVFLMVDSGSIVIWETYYRWTSYIIPRGIDAANKTDTHLPSFSPRVLSHLPPSEKTVFFFFIFLSFLFLTYQLWFLMVIQIGCAEELFI